MNIYVGNLSYKLDENELREAFSAYGEVSKVTLIQDKMTGQSRGFGFVEMPNADEGAAAIAALNEQPLQGRNLKVNEAKPREDRPRGGDRGGFKPRGGDRDGGGFRNRGGDRDGGGFRRRDQ